MGNLYVYRIVVESYPTDDGKPWERYYSLDRTITGEHVKRAPEWLQETILHALNAPPWGDKENLEKWLEAGKSKGIRGQYDAERIVERLRIGADPYGSHGGQGGDPTGVVMPKPWRKHYLSGSGGHQLVRDFNAFGAEARLERSEKVLWEPVAPEITEPLI